MAVFYVQTTVLGGKGTVSFPFQAPGIDTLEALFERLKSDGVVLGEKILTGKYADGERFVRGTEPAILGKNVVGLISAPHFAPAGGWPETSNI